MTGKADQLPWDSIPQLPLGSRQDCCLLASTHPMSSCPLPSLTTNPHLYAQVTLSDACYLIICPAHPLKLSSVQSKSLEKASLECQLGLLSSCCVPGIAAPRLSAAFYQRRQHHPLSGPKSKTPSSSATSMLTDSFLSLHTDHKVTLTIRVAC